MNSFSGFINNAKHTTFLFPVTVKAFPLVATDSYRGNVAQIVCCIQSNKF